MSMNMLTLFQFLQTLAAYLFVTLAIPCAVLSKKLSQYRFMERVLFYFIIGNFYATNLVFLLQLLHISNFFMLWIGLLVAPAVIWVRLNQFPFLDKVRAFGHSTRKLMTGTLSFKSAMDRLWQKIRGYCTEVLRKAGANVRRNWLDWLLVIALVLMVLWVYGTRMFQQFGYAASDVPVHLYWVNGMSDNHIFVAGIYPHGMHAVIYLINECFGIDSYVIFRVFALVQCLAIHMMALLFLKLCCKSRYAAYTGVFLYTIGNFVSFNNISRYPSTMPQETSMIYILPTAYFALWFFREKRRELKEELPEKTSRLALAGLIMSFSLCVTAHFYGAIIAALFCIGIAVGCLGWMIKPAYFKRIIAAALISVAIAVLPMGIAYATGTPLQGSLGWATSQITGSIQREEEQRPESDAQPEDTQNAENTGNPDGPSAAESASSASSPGLLENIVQFPVKLWNVTGDRLESYILGGKDEVTTRYSTVLRGMTVLLFVAGAAMLATRDRMYGAMLLSTGTFMFLMSLMFAATGLGIHALMGADRTCIFFSYMLIIVTGFTVDVCVWTATCMFRSSWPRDILSFAAVAVLGFCIWRQDMIRSPLSNVGLETNEAITCLTNIIATEPDYSWTIFSANDETQMVYGHGYHYETITFLQEIETLGTDMVTIPTETVYFFIEKIPLNYTVSYWGSGQSVSPEGAQKAVPHAPGLEHYSGENRWIVMSHMYYWAQEFQRLYPNEMKVYLETDEFICYRLEQNPYRLYDLAIDYGYNSTKLEEQ